MPAVYTSEFAIAYAEAADAQGLKAPYHLAINSGMNRIGVHYDSAVEFLHQVSFHRALELKGCFTHFATADSLETLDFQIQIKRFVEAMRSIEAAASTRALSIAITPRQRIASRRPTLICAAWAFPCTATKPRPIRTSSSTCVLQ